jgi:Tol biopolymer transport system component
MPTCLACLHRFLTGLACALLLASCGGGGGGGAAGRFIVYLVDTDGDDRGELYVTNLSGDLQIPLSPPTPTPVDVRRFALSPDKTRVAFGSDEGSPGTFNLYVVGVDGGNRVRINGPLLAGSVGNYSWSPSGDRIIYLASEDSATNTELYLANADGSGRHRISGTVGAGQDIGPGAWSPDGRYVLYVVVDGGLVGLNTHDTTSANPRDSVRVTHAGARILSWNWSPDSRNILYGADSAGEPRDQLFLAEADVASSGALVSGSLSSTTEIGDGSFSPDGAYVAYEVLDTSGTFTERVGLNYHEVGGAARNSHSIYREAGDTLRPAGWAPGRNVLAFNVDRAGGDREIWTWNPVDGTRARAVAPAPGGTAAEFRWSPDGSYLVSRVRLDRNSSLELQTLPVPGSGLGTLISRDGNGPTPVGSESDYLASPAGDFVAYQALGLLYVAPAHRTQGAMGVSDPLPVGFVAAPYRYTWTADGRSLVFVAQNGPSQSHLRFLYSVPASGNSPPRRISVGDVATARVFDYEM